MEMDGKALGRRWTRKRRSLPKRGTTFTLFVLLLICVSVFLYRRSFDMLRQSLVGSLFVGLSCQMPFQYTGPLRFKSDGTFQLSIFEDLHFGESETLSHPFNFRPRRINLSYRCLGSVGTSTRH